MISLDPDCDMEDNPNIDVKVEDLLPVIKYVRVKIKESKSVIEDKMKNMFRKTFQAKISDDSNPMKAM